MAEAYSVVQPVPGFGKPLDYVPKRSEDALYVGEPLPTALSPHELLGKAVLPLTTLREFSMLQFMNAITDKENWHIKILNDDIAEKWKTEAIEAAREMLNQSTEDGEDATSAGAEDVGDQDNDDPVESTDNDEPENDGGSTEGTQFDQYPVYFVPRDESSMTVAMANYCIEELRHKARLFQNSPNGAIVVFNGDVVKSDTAVSPDVKSALRKAVQPLENVPEPLKDWHPGSDNKVLDLVHPSLFPLVYGQSKVLPAGANVTSLEAQDSVSRSGEGDLIPVPEIPQVTMPYGFRNIQVDAYSNKFQWLPCEVDIAKERAKILSYINNLHPEKHATLYHVIEDVITAAISLWELTLAPLDDRKFTHPQRITYTACEYDPDPSDWEESEAGPQPENGDFDDDDYYDLKSEWQREVRRVILPEPDNEFDPSHLKPPAPFSLKDRFGKLGRPLQVIVKLANIELTPEKPEYEGGTWHVEGKLNDHIVATALYYYSSSNITSSSLAFRQLSSQEATIDIGYEQNEHDWLSDVFGAENEDAAVQVVGSVETREGRLLTFPNILQHQVQPFSLEDRTKPGHRKILALFLVDPHVRVLSTAHVPPQRMDWWREELEKPQNKAKAPLHGLPLELKDSVFDGVDFPISLTEAKKLREELMDERKNFVLQHDKAFRATTFSLCEH